ncbi:unnamed protein product [Phyllotreta striolata]|uniref:Uncharacterized protein n=1 Tax=Phyllotreta striolata TaxID=444603 RepID=A0A9N9TZF4_PHYSR|nr:unnamed protein product [Phyllotreta striolata]
MAGFIAFIVIINCVFGAAFDSNVSKKSGFVLSMPRVLVAGRNHSVCLSLHNIHIPAESTILLKRKDQRTLITKFIDTEHGCFEIFVGKIGQQEARLINVKVQVQSKGSLYSARNLDPVLVYPSKWTKTFVDTDRAVYKPGDKVRFRVLVVDEKFMPVNIKIPKISIKNPLDVDVVVWEDVILENGLASLEYEMVNQSLLGKWKIETQGETRSFELSKYTLPRFKVHLEAPRRVYFKSKHFEIDVCARYSHGRPVKGSAFVKISNLRGKTRPFDELKEMENGCGKFTVPSEHFLLTSEESEMQLRVTATVTEKGTDIIEVVFGKIVVDFRPYIVRFSNEALFQPGLPYRGKLTFDNVYADLSGEIVRICYSIAIRKSWNYVDDEQCSDFPLSQLDELDFSVLPMTRNVIHVNFYAKSLNRSLVEDTFLAVRLFSPSNSYIQIQSEEKKPEECRLQMQYKITFTTDHFADNETVTFYYIIKSSTNASKMRKIEHRVKKIAPDYRRILGNIVGGKHKHTKSGVHADSFLLRFKLERRITFEYKFLIYYIDKHGETVAASKVIKVQPCLMKVGANWSQRQLVPGSTAYLNIATTSQSLCSVSAVDKSSAFLASNRRIVTDLEALMKSFSPEERDRVNSTRKMCLERDRRHGNSFREWSSKRHVYGFAEDYDALDVFNTFRSVIVTNLRVVSKSCYQGPILSNTDRVQLLTQQYDTNEEQVTSIRSQFEETWLWELIPVRGSIQLKRHLPHGITSYKTNVLCVSDTEGVGIADETDITSFQNVFVEVLAPFSVRRGEIFHLYVHVSNYQHPIPIRLNVGFSAGLESVDVESERSVSYCVGSNDTITHKFKLKALGLGLVNVSVLVETDNQYPMFCGPATILFKRDSEVKSILVEPEGFDLSKTRAALLCASNSLIDDKVFWNVSIPDEIVPGTYKAEVNLNGDILGKTVENLDELLDVPTGCGEQIMSTMAPNLFIMRYLNSTDTLTKPVKQKILRNLKLGYQRILNYLHKDGSFSAFGYHDPMGSTFLTTFVVKILTEAKQFIYIDHHLIQKALTWIYERQLENGCFHSMLHVFQDMGGASSENSTAGLTSYVILSLLQAGIEVPQRVKTNAIYCIRSQVDPDKYSLAINSYALLLMGAEEDGNKSLQRLLASAERHRNMMWWTSKGEASDVEVTSYGLMALLQRNSSKHWADALGVVRWLSTKYGAKGSFVSSQDTAVALEALSKYSGVLKSNELNMLIRVETPHNEYNLTLTDEDGLKSRRIALRASNGSVAIGVVGVGCVLVQITQRYNLMGIAKSEAFEFAMEVAPLSTINRCSISSLSSCLAYKAPDGPSNMAVMEVFLPTGYQADRSSLYKLVQIRNTSKVEMFEEGNDKVNFYLTKLDERLVCFSFNIFERYLVEGRKEALIKLYNYYNPEYEIRQYYNVSSDCSANKSRSEVPEIIGKETNSNRSELVQDLDVTAIDVQL